MDNLINESYAANVPEDFPPIEEAPGIDTADTSGQMFRIGIPNFSWLLARTGEGALESYLNHPMNFDGKLSTAQIIRGLTGIAGTLDYALLDIALGCFEKVRENRAVVKVNNEEINTSF